MVMSVPGAEYSAERVQSEISTLLTHRAPLPPTPKPPAVNWDMWLKMPRVALWEAVALSLNVEPNQNTATGEAFDSRMLLALAHLAEGRLLHVEANDARRVVFTRVRLADMAYLAESCEWALPAEFPKAEAPPPAPSVGQPQAIATLDPAPAENNATPAPVAAESTEQRRARWFDLFSAEKRKKLRGAKQRVYERELLLNPKADRSFIGKEIGKAEAENDKNKQGSAMFGQLGQGGKPKG